MRRIGIECLSSGREGVVYPIMAPDDIYHIDET